MIQGEVTSGRKSEKRNIQNASVDSILALQPRNRADFFFSLFLLPNIYTLTSIERGCIFFLSYTPGSIQGYKNQFILLGISFGSLVPPSTDLLIYLKLSVRNRDLATR